MQKTYCDKCSKEILPCQQTYYALVPGLEIDKKNMKTQYCGQYDPPYSLRQVSECYKGVGREVTMETTQASWRSRHLDEIT